MINQADARALAHTLARTLARTHARTLARTLACTHDLNGMGACLESHARTHKNTISAVQVSSSQAAARLKLVAGLGLAVGGSADHRFNLMIKSRSTHKLVTCRQTLSAFPLQTTLQNADDKLSARRQTLSAFPYRAGKPRLPGYSSA